LKIEGIEREEKIKRRVDTATKKKIKKALNLRERCRCLKLGENIKRNFGVI